MTEPTYHTDDAPDQMSAESGLRGAPYQMPLANRGHGAGQSARPGPVKVGQAMNIAGGLTSLVLICGAVFWAYRLAVRDVTGIPVVRALEGPARIAPADPGGELARHTGLAVNSVAADGTAAAPADTLALAPQRAELGDDVLAMGELQPAPVAELSATPDAEAGDADVAQVAADATSTPIPEGLVPDVLAQAALIEEPMSDEDARARAIALAEQMAAELSLGVPPLSGQAPSVSDSAGTEVAALVTGITTSQRPRARPSGMATAAASEATSAPIRDIGTDAVSAALLEALAPAGEATVREVDPASLAIGTQLVQLGAYDSAEIAKQEWDRAAIQFDPLLLGKGRVVQHLESNGRNLYRLRVEGFADYADASRFCAVLLAKSADCIVTEAR